MKPDITEIRKDREINLLIEKGNEVLRELGYTEHSRKHAAKAAETAGMILKELGYKKRTIELAKIAGYMHDIGNSVNRHDHAHSGAILAYGILKERNMDLEQILTVTAAIGHHDEGTGTAIDPISAALILADKTDVRRDRVRTKEKANFDKHDRVNYAVTNATVKLNLEKKVITLNLQVDEEICSMCEYFEIFLGRMLMCRRASELLGMKFKLTANGRKVL